MTAVFVTGGSSPLGSHLVPELLAAGAQVVALARSDNAAAAMTTLGATVVRADIVETGSWRAVARECDTCIHLAGVRFAPQLLQAVSRNQRLIAVSSASVSNPHHRLAAELAAHEQALIAEFTRCTMLRPTMIYGTARDRNLRHLAGLLLRLPRVPTFTGGNRLQPVYVDDVVAGVMHQLVAPSYQVLPLGGPDRVQLHELVDILAGHLGLARTSLRVPLAPLARLAAIGRLSTLHRVLHAVEMLAYDRTVELPDSAVLGRGPTPLHAGVRQALVTYGLLSGAAT